MRSQLRWMNVGRARGPSGTGVQMRKLEFKTTLFAICAYEPNQRSAPSSALPKVATRSHIYSRGFPYRRAQEPERTAPSKADTTASSEKEL